MTTVYTVQAHDTLSKIAREHNTTVDELVRLNDIQNKNDIKIGQKLIFGEEQLQEVFVTPEKKEQTVTQPQELIGLDTFEKSSDKASVGLGTAVLIGAGSAAAYKGLEKAAPYVAKGAKSAAESGYVEYLYMKDAAKNNLRSARTFIAQKAKHAAKAAELNYAFAKDAVKNGVKSTAQATKEAAEAAASTANKAKVAGQKAAHKIKVNGRYVRLVGNTKVAPAILKGVSKVATPVAAVVGAAEVAHAYKKGGTDAAVKQASKTVSGLGTAWLGAKAGAAIGSVAGPVGTVVGGAIGGVLGYFAGEKAMDMIMG